MCYYICVLLYIYLIPFIAKASQPKHYSGAAGIAEITDKEDSLLDVRRNRQMIHYTAITNSQTKTGGEHIFQTSHQEKSTKQINKNLESITVQQKRRGRFTYKSKTVSCTDENDSQLQIQQHARIN